MQKLLLLIHDAPSASHDFKLGLILLRQRPSCADQSAQTNLISPALELTEQR